MEKTLPKLTKPFKGASTFLISQGFHKDHEALDIVAKYGTPIIAPEKCYVKNDLTDCSFTNEAQCLSRGYGVYLKGLETQNEYIYWHFWAFSPVITGDYVDRGQIIGYMGNSGRVYTGGRFVEYGDRYKSPFPGTHLHMAVFKNGTKALDPIPLIDWDTEPTFSMGDLISSYAKSIKRMSSHVFR